VNILAIDTATPQVSAALGDGGRVLASFRSLAGRRHGESLAPGLAFLAQASGVPLASVEMIAVDAGPGLFTGLRVGLATAKALASALGVEVVALTSLDILAHPHAGAGPWVASVVDARRHEVFWAAYQPAPAGAGDGAPAAPGTPSVPGAPAAPGTSSVPGAPAGLLRVAEPAVAAPPDAATALAGLRDRLGPRLVIVGDGALRYGDVFAGVPGAEIAGPQAAYPGAETVLAMAAADPGRACDPLRVRPLYGRQADVRIGWEQRSA
jgi:tRNA threonylcarbamoyladenosine biosynthesis protein TsaB